MSSIPQYILVSQGIEIYRTTDRKEAEKIMYQNNKEWEKYQENCIENQEYYVDNRIEIYVE